MLKHRDNEPAIFLAAIRAMARDVVYDKEGPSTGTPVFPDSKAKWVNLFTNGLATHLIAAVAMKTIRLSAASEYRRWKAWIDKVIARKIGSISNGYKIATEW